MQRISPRDTLAEFVDYHWLVRWDVPGTHRQQVVPQPRVHVAAEQERILVHGVNREPFERLLSGRGHVLGTAFHPAGFRPFLKRSLATISGTVQPGMAVLGADDRPTAARILADAAPETAADDMVDAMEEYLAGFDPEPDETGGWVNALVAEAERRREIRRAEQLAELGGVSLRTLQRTFTEYVGIGPKWVIQRFRILEAAAAAHSDTPVDWAVLAQDLGFSDQAHLTRVFTQVVGTPPATYRRDPGT